MNWNVMNELYFRFKIWVNTKNCFNVLVLKENQEGILKTNAKNIEEEIEIRAEILIDDIQKIAKDMKTQLKEMKNIKLNK
jgi:hypothetical protein